MSFCCNVLSESFCQRIAVRSWLQFSPNSSDFRKVRESLGLRVITPIELITQLALVGGRRVLSVLSMNQLTLQLPETLHQQLTCLAESEGISLNQYIGRILWLGGMRFSTHFNGFFILARNLFAGGFGCKTIALKGLQNNRCIARS